MKTGLRKYLINLFQFFGFGCSIPFGQYWLDYIFQKDVTNQSLTLSIFVLLVSVFILTVGGIISNESDTKDD